MYKALIVDDEIWVRKGIRKKLQAGEYGFEWIGEAADGEEAMEMIAAERPQLVITDIRMGEMDGIELIRETVERYGETQFVIISGYGEFDYAEQAINMGVAGYILKPIRDDQFHKTMTKVLKELERRSEMASLCTRNDMLEKDRLSAALQQEVFKLLDSNQTAAGIEVDGGLPLFKKAAFVLAILHIDSSSYSVSDFKYMDAGLLKFAVKNILSELWADEEVFIMDDFKGGNRLLALFFSNQAEGLMFACNRLLTGAHSKITGLLKIRMTFAVSSVLDRISSTLYSRAWEAFEARLALGRNCIYRYDQLTPDEKFNIPEQKFVLLRRFWEMRNFSGAQTILRDIFPNPGEGVPSGKYMRYLYTECVNIIFKAGISLGVNVAERIDSSVLSGDLARQFENAGEIVEYVAAIARKVLEPDGYAYIDTEGLVAKVKEYLENNYHADISIGDLATIFAINPNYLSTVYKKKTGKALMRHLMEIRVQHACTLLREGAYSTVEISKSVGYHEPQYFYKVFKKITGKTPLDYRSGT